VGKIALGVNEPGEGAPFTWSSIASVEKGFTVEGFMWLGGYMDLVWALLGIKLPGWSSPSRTSRNACWLPAYVCCFTYQTSSEVYLAYEENGD
jgi:hypothetical protein